MEQEDSRSGRTRICISITQEAHRLLKARASKNNVSVSRMIEDWIQKESRGRSASVIELKLTPDTIDRLEQYAFENHKSAGQAVTDWVWKAKVDRSIIRGQINIHELMG